MKLTEVIEDAALAECRRDGLDPDVFAGVINGCLVTNLDTYVLRIEGAVRSFVVEAYLAGRAALKEMEKTDV